MPTLPTIVTRCGQWFDRQDLPGQSEDHSMNLGRPDVNDRELRESFLRDELVHVLDGLTEASTAGWGQMRPQEMVEHLVWAFRLSTGRDHTDCPVPAADRPRLKEGLYSNTPLPRQIMNPALASGLPPLRFTGLTEARVALADELEHFLDGPRPTQPLHTHPFFGPIGFEEWHRTHYKHTRHHLQQFGLID